MAERILLILAYMSSFTASMSTEAVTAHAAHGPAPGCHTPDHSSTDGNKRACHQHSHQHAHASGKHAVHSHSHAVPSAVQSLSEAHEPDRARPLEEAVKPGKQRALELIAKEAAVKGWQVPLKRRKLREQQAAGQPGTDEQGGRVEKKQDQDPNRVEVAVPTQTQGGASSDPLSTRALDSPAIEAVAIAAALAAQPGKVDTPVPHHHRMDRMFIQTEFLKIEQQIGREFTVDCCCRDDGTNSHCQQFYSPSNSFFQQSLVDQCCWINPPFDNIRETLEHYHACKQQHPDRIKLFSVCLLLGLKTLHPGCIC